MLQLLLLKTAGFSIATGLLFAFTAKGFGRGPLWLTIPVGSSSRSWSGPSSRGC